MVTKSSILGLIAALAVVLIAVSAVGENADSQVPKIGTVEESGFSQSCVETGCYTPSVLTIKSGTVVTMTNTCLLYTSPSPRDGLLSRMPSSA